MYKDRFKGEKNLKNFYFLLFNLKLSEKSVYGRKSKILLNVNNHKYSTNETQKLPRSLEAHSSPFFLCNL
jgi:hypothetical protein